MNSNMEVTLKQLWCPGSVCFLYMYMVILQNGILLIGQGRLLKTMAEIERYLGYLHVHRYSFLLSNTFSHHCFGLVDSGTKDLA